MIRAVYKISVNGNRSSKNLTGIFPVYLDYLIYLIIYSKYEKKFAKI